MEEERRLRFCGWIAANSCSCLRVRPTDLQDERGWGGVAPESVKRGETLLSFPPSMLLDVSAAKRSALLGPELMGSSEKIDDERCVKMFCPCLYLPGS